MKRDDATESTLLSERVLKKLGFRVERISHSKKSGEKTPDFLVCYGSSCALVEAKLKKDDPKEANFRSRELNAGRVYASKHVLGRNDTISGIVKNAKEQLVSDSNPEHDFKILLFFANCINARFVKEQMIDTLYGRTTIIFAETRKSKPCYFYRNSDFYRRKEIDAAIVGHVDSERVNMKACLNPYSSRYLKLKKSDFLFPFKNSILDPLDEEKNGRVFIPDDNIERREQDFTKHFSLYDPVLHHLQEKYGTGILLRGDFNSPEFAIRY